jgi:16S rRNA (cytosine1402-N4)-methyltransferase
MLCDICLPALLSNFAFLCWQVIRGFIVFKTEEGFNSALSWDNCEYGGRHLKIEKATTTGTCQADGTHTPALWKEVLRELIQPDPDGIYVDGTFGRGGHTRVMLERLSPKGRLHAFDMDPEV